MPEFYIERTEQVFSSTGKNIINWMPESNKKYLEFGL